MTDEEISIVGPEDAAPELAAVERGFRCLEVEGPLDFALVGILSSLTATLAAADVSVFVISTFDTDFILVKEADLERSINALRTDGHEVAPPTS